MSYYVIKGPVKFDQYLCVLIGYAHPQWWHAKVDARRFPDPQSAKTWLAEVQKVHSEAGSYEGRVVRVNTVADLKAERLRLRSEVSRHRLQRYERNAVLKEVEHAIMNGPIVRGGYSARTLNEVVAVVRALRTDTARTK